jgi:hypothetical protein
MKIITSLLLLQAIVASSSAFDHSAFDSVLKAQVNDAGQVNYSALKKAHGPVDAYLQQTRVVSQSEFSGWSESERLAFLINVYNAETLQLIIDNYPVTSIKKVGGLLSSPSPLSWACFREL